MKCQMRNDRLFILPVLVWLPCRFANGHASAPSARGQEAPDLNIKSLDGKTPVLKSLIDPGKNRKKVVALVWALAWCAPLAKKPASQRHHEKQSGRQLRWAHPRLQG